MRCTWYVSYIEKSHVLQFPNLVNRNRCLLLTSRTLLNKILDLLSLLKLLASLLLLLPLINSRQLIPERDHIQHPEIFINFIFKPLLIQITTILKSVGSILTGCTNNTTLTLLFKRRYESGSDLAVLRLHVLI